MSNDDEARLAKAAAEYMKAQFGEDAALEASIGRRHAELIGDRATMKAFQAILDHLARIAEPLRDDMNTASGPAQSPSPHKP